ncbi:ABC-type multidrug transport system, ATPase and permease component [Rhodobacteraceae bacterium HIMB11]|nr:ABC-type multidrug transport system, ATPase and permease component [Rhodobacteraceae bacterium HIMB11]
MFRFFENLVDPYSPYEDDMDPPAGLIQYLVYHTKPFRALFLITGIATIFAAVFEIFLLAAIGWVVDLMAAQTPASLWENYTWHFIGLLAFVLILKPTLYLIDFMLISNTLIPNVATLFRWRGHKHVMRQSIGWFEADFAGRVANRVMQTPRSAGEVVFHVFDALAYALAYVVGALFLLMNANTLLLFPLLIWVIAYIFLLRYVVRRVEPASKDSSNARSELNGRVVDTYTNIHSVKMFAHTNSELAYVKNAIEDTRQTVFREMRIYTRMDFILSAMNAMLIAGTVGTALYLWTFDQVTSGEVAAASALVIRFNGMSGWIMWAFTTFFRELGVVGEGLETLAAPVKLLDAPNAKPLQITNATVEFNNLTHHYGRETGGLDNLSLRVEAGQKVGLVGRSGAGKSTLFKLLLRFYDTESGQILIDGQDISHVTQDSLRHEIGMVQQESSLLHRSIRENILYGREGANDTDMIAAAQQAEAHEFIQTLEDQSGNTGYDSTVGERGVKLSGGQRQRIALARVILKDGPILLLDEATSALDSEVEATILDTLYQLMEGKTVIAIAHRLSTIAQMDRIVVMDEGRIIEDGTHDALLQKGGLYAQLWARQSGGFLNADDDV